jgi:hypothetical protein
MTTYLTIDEDTFVADRADELVSLMRDASLIAAASDVEFMKQRASREAFNSGAVIRTDTAENFVADLITSGYLKITADAVEGDNDVKEKE